MAALLAFPVRAPAPPCEVISLREARRDLMREGRQRLARQRALDEVMAAFPDVDWLREPGAMVALVELALERVAANPDFAGEIEVVA